MTDKANAPYPYLGINGEYLDREFLLSVEKELVAKTPVWAAGLDTPSACEKFAFHVMKMLKMNARWGE